MPRPGLAIAGPKRRHGATAGRALPHEDDAARTAEEHLRNVARWREAERTRAAR